MALVRGSTFSEIVALDGWAFAQAAAETPEELGQVEVHWLPLAEPTTVAAGLRSHGQWDFDRPRPFDDETWWFRARIPELHSGSAHRLESAHRLKLGGLATLCDVFVDGKHVLHSENMFHEHRVDLDEVLRGSSGPTELLLRFAPLTPALAVKRPRPRWKTRLAAHQQLRWIRTSLVGRMPGWSPPVPAVGPWRPIVLERWSSAVIDDVSLRTSVANGEGRVRAELRLALSAAHSESQAGLRAFLHVGDVRAPLEPRSSSAANTVAFAGEVALRDPKLWWPHTHGPQDRYPARITLEIDGAEETIDLGHVAFRSLRLDTADRRFTLHVNDVPIFCRGACWTTNDVTTLTTAPDEYARVLGSVRDAGMNMLRMSGTLFYEADAFYETCDALGILVWQDFMFANMDYPDGDESFRASVTTEARQMLARLEARPSLAVLCGGSEVEQQAAMFGAPRGIWRATLFDRLLPEEAAQICPEVPWCPSSPSGGALPFHVDEGASHYYGVGAYLRPFDDARRANVKFASECLAFANVPEDDLFPRFLADGQAPFVHARWKERTSKDNGSGWDFEDVRDHYLRELFRVDPMRLRYEDMNRYLALSRVTSGEVMARVFAEFRRRDSSCKGGLVWFLQDLWPGAGWGVLDSRGLPKSAYWFLKRVLQPLGLFITDEGVNGLHLHVVNDRAADLSATLRFTLHRDGEVRTAEGSTDVVVPARSAITVAGDGLFDSFTDSARAYRFGPPSHDLAVATLLDRDGTAVATATHLLDFAAPPQCTGLEGFLSRSPEGTLTATVRTKRFAHAVAISVPNHVPEDNYFDLPPEGERTVVLREITKSPRAPSGEASALNLRHPVRLELRRAQD
jgi:beta-mannosidase